jgi:hypothetical protein
LDHYSILGEPEQPKAKAEQHSAPKDTSSAADLNAVQNLRFTDDTAGNAAPEHDLESTLRKIAQEAQYVTGASGAAIALKVGKVLVCRAASGNAPDVGVQLQVKSGLTAECIRSQTTQRCDNTSTDERVDRDSCARLGIESIIVVPVFRARKLVGIFEIFAKQAYAFQERDVEALRSFAEKISTALTGAAPVAEESEGWDALLPVDKAQLQVVASKPTICADCGGPVDQDSLECQECGKFTRGVPAPDPSPFRERLAAFFGIGAEGGVRVSRILLPVAFLALATVLIFIPIRHTAVHVETAVATRPPSTQTAPAASPVDSAQAPASSPASTSDPTRQPASSTEVQPQGFAASLKNMAADARSDVLHMLAIDREEQPVAVSLGNPQVKVWVDTRKGLYYCPGDAPYAKTPHGLYMTQHDAQADFYTPGLQKNCQ